MSFDFYQESIIGTTPHDVFYFDKSIFGIPLLPTIHRLCWLGNIDWEMLSKVPYYSIIGIVHQIDTIYKNKKLINLVKLINEDICRSIDHDLILSKFMMTNDIRFCDDGNFCRIVTGIIEKNNNLRTKRRMLKFYVDYYQMDGFGQDCLNTNFREGYDENFLIRTANDFPTFKMILETLNVEPSVIKICLFEILKCGDEKSFLWCIEKHPSMMDHVANQVVDYCKHFQKNSLLNKIGEIRLGFTCPTLIN